MPTIHPVRVNIRVIVVSIINPAGGQRPVP